EKNIGRCLESVKGLADEIIVVDSLSTDRTKEICLSYGVTFIEQAFLGYIEQKNFALDKASHDYILSLDADEALDDNLRKSILAEKEKSFPADCYEMNRLSSFCGQWIKHGTWYPDRKLRLLNRRRGRWGGTNPHDKIVMQDGANKQHLKGDILHYTYNSIEEIILQTNRFTNTQSLAMYRQGKRSSVFKLVVNPLMAFISGYFIKLGFLDGYNGFLIARYASYSTFIKYSKLLHLQRQNVNREA
ncbi:MAG: glycosyltransferase family 2 protein, partial [Bacteroidetes bacterium]|nr:glycosyltransferase family 2 protein [Bacteroidota bacterium]